MSVIEVEGIHRTFGAVHALTDVSFTVPAGEIVGLLGPNGAGKTTLLRILAGVLAPTAGSVRIGGHDVLLDPLPVRRALGWLPEGAPLYDEMTVRAFLAFVARARGLARSGAALAIDRVAHDCGLSDHLGVVIATLSRGYRQRVGLAQSLLHQPQILVLDEPTTGLDPNQVVEIRDLVRGLGATRTVLLSTHVLPEVQAVCDRVLILHRGELVADERTDRLTAAAQGLVCEVALGPSKVKAGAEQIAEQLAALVGVTAVHRLSGASAGEGEGEGELSGPRFEVHADHDVRAALFRWAVERGHVLVELSPRRRTLEAVFRSLTEAA